MDNAICRMFGNSVPILAFSHCRDVVLEVSKAGGIGVLGMAYLTLEQAQVDLKWIDERIGDKPYGIDILAGYKGAVETDFVPELQFSEQHRDFIQNILDEAGIPREKDPIAEASLISQEMKVVGPSFETFSFMPNEDEEMFELALKHKVKLLVSAFGTPPQSYIDRARERGLKVAALASDPKHALKHKAAGLDFVIAVGTEAGGHTGSVTSLVLWPRIVDAVSPMPVVGGGGVGRGRQLAAALALGCEGVWCGSVWLNTVESEVTPEIKAKMFAARSEDAVITRSLTGKPCRVLRSGYTDAWERKDAPPLLPPARQALLWWGMGRRRVAKSQAPEFVTYPVGQIVGDMTQETSVRQVVEGMLHEFLESKERLDRFFG